MTSTRPRTPLGPRLHLRPYLQVGSAPISRRTWIIYMALRFMERSSFSRGDRRHVAIGSDRSQPVAERLFFGCAQYAVGSKKVRFPALLNEIFEMSGVNMIRPNHGGEAIESPSPPELKGNWIKIRVKHTPPCFYQIVDSLFDSHVDPFNQECSVTDLGKHPHPPVAAYLLQPHRPQSTYRLFPPTRPQ